MRLKYTMRIDNTILKDHTNDPGFKENYIKRKICEQLSSEIMHFIDVKETKEKYETEFSAVIDFLPVENIDHIKGHLKVLELASPSVRKVVQSILRELGPLY